MNPPEYVFTTSNLRVGDQLSALPPDETHAWKLQSWCSTPGSGDASDADWLVVTCLWQRLPDPSKEPPP